MNLNVIHHVAIIVSDYQKAKAFYVDRLGFPVIRENYRPERGDWKLDLRLNETTELEIFAEPDPPKRVSRPEACGLRHLAFRVDDVETAAAELAAVRSVDGEPITPARVRLLRKGKETAELSVTIHEGKNRQIRRMCAAVGLHVKRLRRVREHTLSLGALPEGGWRELTADEVRAFEQEK